MASTNSQYQVRNKYNAAFAARHWRQAREHAAVWHVTFMFAVLAINAVDPHRRQPDNNNHHRHHVSKEHRFRFLVRYHDSKLHLTCV
jgi:hypothetical protein